MKTYLLKRYPVFIEFMACELSHTSDFELQIAEPLLNGKIVKKKHPWRLRKSGVLLFNNFSIEKWLCDS